MKVMNNSRKNRIDRIIDDGRCNKPGDNDCDALISYFWKNCSVVQFVTFRINTSPDMTFGKHWNVFI